MLFLPSLVSWFIRQRMESIQQAAHHPIETQERLLRELLQAARLTEWGQKFDYASVKTPRQFSERVPLQDYESLKPFIERMMKGEQNVLWHSEITWFAKSSGTTSDRSKFIPVSQEGLNGCHFKGGRDTLAVYCHNHPGTKIFSGKGLLMGGSHQIHQLNEDCRYGDVSAVMMQNMPLLAHWLKTPELSVALMDNWEEKLERMTEITIRQNVTHLAGVPTWTLILLRKILEKTGKQNIADVWRNLELYIHGGVSFTPYREQFKNLIQSDNMHYVETYNASEGFFALQDSENSDDLLLLTDNGVYYEFLEAASPPPPLPGRRESERNVISKLIPLAEAKVGKTYSLVISTSSGLWRYQIGDTVQFTSIRPYKIKIAGRTKHFINVFGEEVMVDNTDRAIAETCKKTGAVVSDYTVAPIFLEGNKKGGHEWLIEFEKTPADLKEFTFLLDECLRSLNSDYDAKRFKDIALRLPAVHSLPQGTFYNWLKSKGKLGGQNKVPRLANDRKLIEEILTFIS